MAEPADYAPRDSLPRHTGVVRFFNGRRAYGFITPDGGTEDNPKKDVFVHKSELPRGKTLKENDVVEFSIVEEADGRLKAVDVTGGTLEKQNICYAYQENGYCSYGDRCKFAHTYQVCPPAGGRSQRYDDYGRSDDGYKSERYASGPNISRDDGAYGRSSYSSGESYRSQGICYKYRDTGMCNFGSSCRFLHSDPPTDY
jgi:cold shock CspA family protein